MSKTFCGVIDSTLKAPRSISAYLQFTHSIEEQAATLPFTRAMCSCFYEVMLFGSTEYDATQNTERGTVWPLRN